MSRMSCPWCGRTMVPGELESLRPITWYPSEPSSSIRNFLSWKGIRELFAPITGNIQVPWQGRWERSRTQIPVNHCPECDRFVIDGRVKEE